MFKFLIKSQSKEIKRLNHIVSIYRELRKYDGHRGRDWSALKNSDYEMALHRLGEPHSTQWHLDMEKYENDE